MTGIQTQVRAQCPPLNYPAIPCLFHLFPVLPFSSDWYESLTADSKYSQACLFVYYQLSTRSAILPADRGGMLYSQAM